MKNHDGSSKKHSPIKIRSMEIGDLGKVFYLGEELFTAKKVPTLYRTWDEFEVINIFQTDGESCLVAETEKEEKIAGFILGTTIKKSHSAWKYGWLVWIGVDPAYQRQGIAEKLCNSFMDIMVKSGVRMVLIDTEADNVSAIKFFKKLGFKNPQDHVFLALNLDARRREVKEKDGKQIND